MEIGTTILRLYGLILALWFGWVSAFCIQMIRTIPRRTKSTGQKVWEFFQGLLFLLGLIGMPTAISIFMDITGKPIWSTLFVACLICGLVISIFTKKDSEWAIRYKDRQCGDRTIPPDVDK